MAFLSQASASAWLSPSRFSVLDPEIPASSKKPMREASFAVSPGFDLRPLGLEADPVPGLVLRAHPDVAHGLHLGLALHRSPLSLMETHSGGIPGLPQA